MLLFAPSAEHVSKWRWFTLSSREVSPRHRAASEQRGRGRPVLRGDGHRHPGGRHRGDHQVRDPGRDGPLQYVWNNTHRFELWYKVFVSHYVRLSLQLIIAQSAVFLTMSGSSRTSPSSNCRRTRWKWRFLLSFSWRRTASSPQVTTNQLVCLCCRISVFKGTNNRRNEENLPNWEYFP